MIRIGEQYSRPDLSGNGWAYFKIHATNLAELKAFWTAHKTTLDLPHFDPLSDITIELKVNKQEQVRNLAYNFNTVQSGNELVLEKALFLKHGALDAVKAIIYATDHVPTQMTIDEYASAVLMAYENYNESVGFDKRVMNMALDVNNGSAAKLSNISDQVRLFKQLLFVPDTGNETGEDYADNEESGSSELD